MPRRTIVIGDIHGCSHAIDALIRAIAPGPDDTLITLGDMIDRGPDSRGVVDLLIDVSSRCRFVPILGNHDEMLLDALHDPRALAMWTSCGGAATLDSYGGTLDGIPEAHRDFLRSCLDWYATDGHFYTHACYSEALPLERQSAIDLRWRSLRDGLPGRHASGKVAVLGHTSQKDGVVLDGGHFVCIDTYCYGGGWLTALEIESGCYWQASADGQIRATPTEVRRVAFDEEE